MEIENILAKKGIDIENAPIKEMNEISEGSKNNKKQAPVIDETY